jgi:signal transduction histidine kinase/AmiR/NasT family two-component response regulator
MKYLCHDSMGNAPFWPANGVVVAGLLVLGRRTGWVFCAVCLVIDTAENMAQGLPLSNSFSVAMLNLGLSVATALLTRTFCGAATDLARVNRLIRFAMIALVAALGEATLGEWLTWVPAPGTNLLGDYIEWIACDSLGLIISTPAILLALQYRHTSEPPRLEPWLLLAATTTITVLGFWRSGPLWVVLVYPMLLLTAFRAGSQWVLASVMLIALPATAFTIHGFGPLAMVSPAGYKLQQTVQIFIVSVFFCAVPATNALAESRRTAQRLRRIHTEARRARIAAEAANYSKSQFIANMSHEIRTPLNGVLGLSQAMAADDLSAAQRERLHLIHTSGEMLLAILNDVLDLSKIEAGKLQLEMEPFSINDLAQGAVATFNVMAQSKDLSFDLSVSPDAVGVYIGDSIRVRQILYNLVSNALKFTTSGQVSVTVSAAVPGLLIRVADTGIGIPQDRVAHLFQKFEQADLSTTRRFGGTGLGLAICRELTELMGGEIFVESVEGEGSTFSVRLPLALAGAGITAPSAADIAGASTSTAGREPLRILAAEDNRVNQIVLTTLLSQLGMFPVMVDNGEAAVRAWSDQEWDVILMDMQMPVMDGLAATRAIRVLESELNRSRTPIIALTANVMSHQLQSYRTAGMDCFVAKPIELGQLVASLETVLEQAETAEMPAEAEALT